MEGHTAIMHTAAASNLGQMLNKICQADGVDIVNIVRSQEQVDILRGLDARYIMRFLTECPFESGQGHHLLFWLTYRVDRCVHRIDEAKAARIAQQA